MTIEKGGSWWKGTDPADLDEYLRTYAAGGYPPDRFVHPVCGCGSARFRLAADDVEGVVQRTCAGCGAAQSMLDSDELIDEAEPQDCACPCEAEVFQLSVAFAHREDGSVRWVTVGGRCISCGVLGVYADWKLDYEPTDHLYARV